MVITCEHLCLCLTSKGVTAASLRPEKTGLGQALGVKQLDNSCAQCEQVKLTPILSGKVTVAQVVGPSQDGELDMLQHWYYNTPVICQFISMMGGSTGVVPNPLFR